MAGFRGKINSELNVAYGNFVHRILTLGARLPVKFGPYALLERKDVNSNHISKLNTMHKDISESLNKHRYKEALRTAKESAQYGNQIILSEPWKYLVVDQQKYR